MTGYVRISKREFYIAGGFSNPRLKRISVGRTFAYYRQAE